MLKHRIPGYDLGMIPADGANPGDFFIGVDFTVEIRRPGVFNQTQLEESIRAVVSEFFEERHITPRYCWQGGLGGASGQQLVEFLNWIRENWELLSGLVAFLVALVHRIRKLIQRERTRVTNGFIDPYRPGAIVTVSPRNGAFGSDASEIDLADFSNVLWMLPELHAALTARVSTHDFSMRAIRAKHGGSLNVLFKLKKTTSKDVVMMLKKIQRLDQSNPHASTILLFRQFGLFRRFDVSRRPQDLYRLLAR